MKKINTKKKTKMKKNKRIVCFSTGNLYKSFSSIHKKIDFCSDLDVDGIELLFAYAQDLLKFKLKKSQLAKLRKFKYNTIHLPFYKDKKKNYFYYEFEIEALRSVSKSFGGYKPTSKYPPQIEDITLGFPEKTKLGEVIKFAVSTSVLISNMELVDSFENSITFRIWYQDPSKTLVDTEVKTIREKLIAELKNKFGATFKG